MKCNKLKCDTVRYISNEPFDLWLFSDSTSVSELLTPIQLLPSRLQTLGSSSGLILPSVDRGFPGDSGQDVQSCLARWAIPEQAGVLQDAVDCLLALVAVTGAQSPPLHLNFLLEESPGMFYSSQPRGGDTMKSVPPVEWITLSH